MIMDQFLECLFFLLSFPVFTERNIN